MSDEKIVNTLRKHAWIADRTGGAHCNLLHEAADEIEKLRTTSAAAIRDFNAVINFVLDHAGSEGHTFLQLWREGAWDVIEREFPEFDLIRCEAATLTRD